MSQKTVQILNIRSYSHICYQISLTEAILELYDISLQVKVPNIMTLTKLAPETQKMSDLTVWQKPLFIKKFQAYPQKVGSPVFDSCFYL